MGGGIFVIFIAEQDRVLVSKTFKSNCRYKISPHIAETIQAKFKLSPDSSYKLNVFLTVHHELTIY